MTNEQIAEIGGLRLTADTCLAPDAIEVRILGLYGGEVALLNYGRVGDVVAALTTAVSPSEAAPMTAAVRAIMGAGSDAEVYRRCVAFVHRLLTPEV